MLGTWKCSGISERESDVLLRDSEQLEKFCFIVIVMKRNALLTEYLLPVGDCPLRCLKLKDGQSLGGVNLGCRGFAHRLSS